MRLDIGIASYNNAQYLQEAVAHILANTTGDWRLLVVDNASTDPQVRPLLEGYAAAHGNVEVRFRETNSGYAGAVNELLNWSDAPFFAFCDNDCNILTHGWNDLMLRPLTTHHEVAMVSPLTYASYPIPGPDYTEVLWATGCFWMMNRARLNDVGGMDETLGHQEEADLALRVILGGWKWVGVPDVSIQHVGASTINPAAQERINNGVIRFVNKWNTYFCGPTVNYHSPNVTRWENWPPVALYLERFMKPHLPAGLNDSVETVHILGQPWQLVKVPRWPDLYRDRTI